MKQTGNYCGADTNSSRRFSWNLRWQDAGRALTAHLNNVRLMQTIVYKVLPASVWQAACAAGAYSGSRDDERDGFIHLSCAHQLAGTLAKYFCGQPALLLVAFASAELGAALKFEPSRGGDLFPHLYGPLPTACALWQRPLELGADGVPVVKEDWLEC